MRWVVRTDTHAVHLLLQNVLTLLRGIKIEEIRACASHHVIRNWPVCVRTIKWMSNTIGARYTHVLHSSNSWKTKCTFFPPFCPHPPNLVYVFSSKHARQEEERTKAMKEGGGTNDARCNATKQLA
jgi:hypothetical protein